MVLTFIGFIEKHTWAGLEEFYISLDKALQAECCVDEELIAEEEVEVPPKMRRRIRGSARRLSSTRHVDEAMVPRSRSSTGRCVSEGLVHILAFVNTINNSRNLLSIYQVVVGFAYLTAHKQNNSEESYFKLSFY